MKDQLSNTSVSAMQSRRSFIKNISMAGAAVGVLNTVSVSANISGPKVLRVATIGAGARGCGAMNDLRKAADLVGGLRLEFVAIANVHRQEARTTGRHFGVSEAHCFGGFDSYRKALEMGPDLVVLATPPVFRPLHFEAAVEAGCHCFIEKPVAVDAPGARRMSAAGQRAREKGLSVVAGTQRRHQPRRQALVKSIQAGEYGDIKGGRVMWLSRVPWVRPRAAGESNANYLARNWLNFVEMSGDHIAEQHVHNLDIANWYIGRHPRAAIGFGGRMQRKTGNQYDFFSVDFDYGQGCNIHSMCRQMNGVYTRIGEELHGSIRSIPTFGDGGMVDEQAALLRSIVEGRGDNETEAVTDSTVAAIMGRESAYTGQVVRWVDLLENTQSSHYSKQFSPTAEDFENADDVALPQEETAPVPGQQDA